MLWRKNPAGTWKSSGVIKNLVKTSVLVSSKVPIKSFKKASGKVDAGNTLKYQGSRNAEEDNSHDSFLTVSMWCLHYFESRLKGKQVLH